MPPSDDEAVDSHLPISHFTIYRIPDRQGEKKQSHVPCPNFGESGFPGSSQISFSLNMICVFPNPSTYFGQIPDQKTDQLNENNAKIHE